MGAWGYGYKDNDNYYNEAAEFTEPLIKALTEYGKTSTRHEFHIRLLWTVNLLKSTEEAVVLSDWSVTALQVAVSVLRSTLPDDAKDWREPDEYIRIVTDELTGVEEWLDSLTEPTLADRLGAIVGSIGDL